MQHGSPLIVHLIVRNSGCLTFGLSRVVLRAGHAGSLSLLTSHMVPKVTFEAVGFGLNTGARPPSKSDTTENEDAQDFKWPRWDASYFLLYSAPNGRVSCLRIKRVAKVHNSLPSINTRDGTSMQMWK